jgi:hypothetical protein
VKPHLERGLAGDAIGDRLDPTGSHADHVDALDRSRHVRRSSPIASSIGNVADDRGSRAGRITSLEQLL